MVHTGNEYHIVLIDILRKIEQREEEEAENTLKYLHTVHTSPTND